MNGNKIFVVPHRLLMALGLLVFFPVGVICHQIERWVPAQSFMKRGYRMGWNLSTVLTACVERDLAERQAAAAPTARIYAWPNGSESLR
jgi:hypothetical protein